MKKKNCWEFKGCGNEPGGGPEGKNGNCPVPKMSMYNGINDGRNGGRVCWIIADTSCEGDVQVTFHHKLETCAKCDFYLTVKEEEGGDPTIPLGVLENLCNYSRKC